MAKTKTNFWQGIIVMILIFGSCESSQKNNYRNLGSDVFGSTFEDIFNLLLDSVPERDASFFLDTISIEDGSMHLSPMEAVLDDIPDDWPQLLVADLISDFNLNQLSISIKNLDLNQRIIVDTKSVQSIVSSNDRRHFGSLRLSNFFYTPEKNKVIFFIAIYCGNQCSEAGIAYARKTKGGEWKLDSVLEVWGSGSE
jgi:hypothetical protein